MIFSLELSFAILTLLARDTETTSLAENQLCYKIEK